MRGPLRRLLLRLLSLTEAAPVSSAPSARRPPLLLRDVRIPSELVGLTLWIMLWVVMYQQLGPGWGKGLAVLVVTGLVVFFLTFYLKHEQPELLADEEAVALLGLVLFAAVWMMELWVEMARLAPRNLSPLGIPLASAPLLVSLLLSPRLAVIVAVTLAVLYGAVHRFSFDGAFVVLLGGVAGVAGSLRVRARRDLAQAGLWIAVAKGLGVLALSLLRDWPAQETVFAFGWVLVSGVISTFLVGGVMPYLENFFSRLTPMRLLELCDVNHPLLRRMSVEAPGTYHHSMIMASLAQTAAESVGANGLLCRAGAYFHDIGKMVKPEYFVENQGSLGNPHDPLPPNMSRLVIQSHVKEGQALARQYDLPKPVADFIGTHHGTSRIEYFYRRALEKTDDLDTVDEDDYRYPGPRPYSRETAILMLADGVEASVRTLDEATPQRIRDQIRKIIDGKMSDGQLDNVALTLQDIHRIGESFFNTLTGVYHARIKYPDQEKGQAA